MEEDSNRNMHSCHYNHVLALCMIIVLINSPYLFPYRVLVEQLEKVNLGSTEINAKTAFWINVYNSLIMHVSLRSCFRIFFPYFYFYDWH